MQAKNVNQDDALYPCSFVIFGAIVSNLAAVGLNRPRGLHRIVVEKPFGEDIGSAQQLNQLLHSHFDEQQIYRIDHYLAKQSVQNLLVFRFANLMIEPPAALEADALRDEKVKVLRSIRPISADAVHAHAVRGQYGPGNVEGRQVPGYQGEAGVGKDSTTETYIAAKFLIDNWRWRGVPFYLRTGKRLAKQMPMIALRFRDPPQQLFRETPLENMTPTKPCYRT